MREPRITRKLVGKILAGFDNGDSPDDIADVLDVPVSWVKAVLKATKQVRQNPVGNVFNAKFGGRCGANCGKSIQAGDRVMVVGENPMVVAHPDCGKKLLARGGPVQAPKPVVAAGVRCPECDGPMKERDGPYGKFYGCLKYPSCKGRRALDGKAGAVRDEGAAPGVPGRCKNAEKIGKIVPSKFQLDIKREYLTSKAHLIIDAKAGSGKTSTLEWIVCTTPCRKSEVAFLAFNTSIADELRDRLDQVVTVSTMHSLGYIAGLKHFGLKADSIDLNKHKISQICEELWPTALEHTVEDNRGRRKERTKFYDEKGIFRETKQEDVDFHKLQNPPLVNLVEKVRNTLSFDFDDLIQRFGIEVEEPDSAEQANLILEKVKSYVPKVLAKDEEWGAIGKWDFTDQIWFPHRFNLLPRQFETVFVDETQDLNKAQHELALKAANVYDRFGKLRNVAAEKTGRVIAVGDPFQSIYGFRGADTQGMRNLENLLALTQRGVKKLPLSISYRCPEMVIRKAQTLVPDIQWNEARTDKGSVETIYSDQMLKLIKKNIADGESVMVLSRVNAALVNPCFALIKDRIPARIEGREMVSELKNYIEKINPKRNNDINIFLRAAATWKEREAKKLEDQKLSPQTLIDKVETLEALSHNTSTVSELIEVIDCIFSDSQTKKGKKKLDSAKRAAQALLRKERCEKLGITDAKGNVVVCSTVHKAKGLEAHNVYIVAPEKMPLPVKFEWEVEQERNIMYVAYTRPMKNLYFVEGDVENRPEKLAPHEAQAIEEIREREEKERQRSVEADDKSLRDKYSLDDL